MASPSPSQNIAFRSLNAAIATTFDAIAAAGSWCFERSHTAQCPPTHYCIGSSETVSTKGISGDLPRLAITVVKDSKDDVIVVAPEQGDERWTQIGRTVCAIASMVRESSKVPDAFLQNRTTPVDNQPSADIHQKLLKALREMGDATTTAKVLSCCTQGNLFPFIMFMHQWLQRYWSPRWDNNEWNTFFEEVVDQQGAPQNQERDANGVAVVSVRVRHEFISCNNSAKSRAKLSYCAVPSIEISWELIAVVTSPLVSDGIQANVTIDWSINVLRVTEVFPDDDVPATTTVPWYVRAMRRCSAPLASARYRQLAHYVSEHALATLTHHRDTPLLGGG